MEKVQKTFELILTFSRPIKDPQYICERILKAIEIEVLYGVGIVSEKDDAYTVSASARHIGPDGIATTPFRILEI